MNEHHYNRGRPRHRLAQYSLQVYLSSVSIKVNEKVLYFINTIDRKCQIHLHLKVS